MQFVISIRSDAQYKSFLLKERGNEYFFYKIEWKNAKDVYLSQELQENYWWDRIVYIQFENYNYEVKLRNHWSLFDLIENLKINS